MSVVLASFGLLAATGMPGCGDPADNGGDSCSVAQDCWRSDAAQELGRCAPKEVACIDGRCRAACPTPCAVDDTTPDPCGGGGRICNQPQNGREGASICTAIPISCVSEFDCPLSQPPVPSNALSFNPPSLWSCTDGFCRYPGFEYAWD